jgi:hypothetical protein
MCAASVLVSYRVPQAFGFAGLDLALRSQEGDPVFSNDFWRWSGEAGGNGLWLSVAI